ncbi:MAG: glycosyltransferase family 1 protein [Patescibacteria group bacterium]|jgi:glycosyltransferase involved in cell wall biosynthesis
MIIGIDASRANRPQKTGVEWYSYHLIQELKKIPLPQGDKFILYAPEELKGDLGIMPAGWKTKILSWPLKYFWTQKRLSWEMLINPPDILFVPAHCLPIFCRAKKIMTIHDLGFKRFPKAYTFGQRIYYSMVHSFAAKYADKIITPSEFTKTEIINLYKTDPNKIVITPLGYNKYYNLIEDKNKIEEILAKYQIKKPYLFFVGRLEKKKNIKGLIDAYQQLLKQKYSLQLVLAGSPGFGYQEVKSQIKSLGENIRQINYVEPKDLVYLYASAEAFIFPSFYEGFGIPLLEAMACGCPIVASNQGSLPEVAQDAALYFDPRNSLQMVEAIKRIINEQDLRKELIEKGLARVKEFSWQKCAEKTFKIFKNII